MNFKKLLSPGGIFTLLAVISLIFAFYFYIVNYSSPDLSDIISKSFSEADKIEQINGSPQVYAGRENDEVVGYGVIESGSGYQSDIEVLTVINSEGEITDIEVVREQETPFFFNRVRENEEFFNQFLGRTVDQELVINQNIEGITGATVSTEAIINAVNRGSNFVGSEYLGMVSGTPGYNFEFTVQDLMIVIAFLLAFGIYKFPNKKLRIAVMFYSVIVLGFTYKQFIIFGDLGVIFSGSLPGFLDNLTWYLLMLGALLMVILTGKNIYCYWGVCPFGAFQELAARLTGIRFRPGQKVNKVALKLPAFFTWLALFLALLVGKPSGVSFEPFVTLFSQEGSGLRWFLLFISLTASLFIFRFWCRYFCPVGYILKLVAKLRCLGVEKCLNRNEKRTGKM